MIDIFLSRPSWVGPTFLPGLNGFLNQMKLLNLNPRTIGVTDYPNHSPLDEVITLMGKCAGAIILGYPQLQVSSGFLKEEKINSLQLPTEWNHIEAALAYARGLHLVVIHHLGVGRGVFDHGALNCFIYETDFNKPSWPLDEKIIGAIKAWKENLQCNKTDEAVISPHQQAEIPYCPNCSQGGKRVYMNPIYPGLVDHYNATHECQKCFFRGKY